MNGWRQSSSALPTGAALQQPSAARFAAALDGAIEALLIALFAFMPAAFGAVQSWAHAAVMFGVAGLAVGLLVRGVTRRGSTMARTWALLPMALFVALVGLQLVPLPTSWMRWIAPATVARKSQLLADVPQSASVLRRMTISFYPLATEHDLRLVLAACIVFITVLTVIKTRQQILRLLVAIVCIGALVALIAAAQDVTGAKGIYWSVATPAPIANAGTFVLYNSYAQFMNLSLGAAIALLVYLLAEQTPAGEDDAAPPRHRSRRSSRPRVSPEAVVAWRNRRAALLICFIVLGTCTLMLSGSRGGTLALIISFFALVVVLGRHRSMKQSSWVLVLVGGVVFASLLYVGFDAVCDRLATLHNRADPTSGRLQSFKDVASIWRRFPVLGTGLGTHEFVYPAYEHSNNPQLAEQADGDYIQAAEEVGAVGLGLILLFAGIVWRHLAATIAKGSKRRSKSTPKDPLRVLSYGLGFGLLAVMIQSFVDFGQHLLAIGCLSAAFCALIINLDPSRSRRSESKSVEPPAEADADAAILPARGIAWWPRAGAIALAVALLAAGAWMSMSAQRAARADAYSAQASEIATNLDAHDWQGNRNTYVRLLTAAGAAAAEEPRDVTFQYFLNCYRWQTILRSGGITDGFEATPHRLESARRVVGELAKSRALCPVYGPTLAVMGQIEYFALGEAEVGSEHVKAAYQLWPNHPAVCLAAGSVCAAEHQWDLAVPYFRHCLQLDSSLFPQILQILLVREHRPDMAVAVSRGDPERLLDVIHYLPRGNGSADALAKAARRDAMKELDSRCAESDTPAWMLAQAGYLHREDGDIDQATALFQRAVTLEYGNVDWRFMLADLLRTQGKMPEAAHQAEICLRLHPQMAEATKLIGELNADPEAHLDGETQ